jgi:methionine synthase II (cobalamin-independent)
MLRTDRRFVVSHVGSMVRPPAMIPYLQKAQAGEPYDKAAFEACLTDSVIEAVRLQAEAGMDVVSDGEYGKSGTWAFYVHRRLKGIEWHPFTEAEAKDPTIAVISGRDREAFPEFYAEYDARVLAVSRRLSLSGPPSAYRIRKVRCVAHKAAQCHGLASSISRRHCIARRQSHYLIAVREKKNRTRSQRERQHASERDS